jgi:periplasmic nitrate reductase NapD
MREEVHISSLIVQGMPASLPAIRAAMTAMDGVEVHAEGAGKLVVVLETANEGEIVSRLGEIGSLDGVLSTSLVFHQVEDADAMGDIGEEVP